MLNKFMLVFKLEPGMVGKCLEPHCRSALKHKRAQSGVKVTRKTPSESSIVLLQLKKQKIYEKIKCDLTFVMVKMCNSAGNCSKVVVSPWLPL